MESHRGRPFRAGVFLLFLASCSGCCGSKEHKEPTPATAGVSPGFGNTNTTPGAATATRTPTPTPTPTPTNPAPARIPAGPGKTQRVRFKPGTSGAEIRDSVIRGERNRYLIGAGKGQTMTVSVTALEDNAAFSIIAPDGKTIPGTEEPRDLKKWKGNLPASGETIVSVGPTRGNATFVLKIEVTGTPQR
jgi:hypothetical protein